MGLPKDVWEKLKTLWINRPVNYKLDEKGHEIKFPAVRRQGIPLGKHDASKLGYQHKVHAVARARAHLPSQHERTVILRARGMRISVAEYERRFPKG